MATTTIRFDERTDKVLERLQEAYSAPTKTELIRRAIAVLELARIAREQGKDLALVPQDLVNGGITRIVVP